MHDKMKIMFVFLYLKNSRVIDVMDIDDTIKHRLYVFIYTSFYYDPIYVCSF